MTKLQAIEILLDELDHSDGAISIVTKDGNGLIYSKKDTDSNILMFLKSFLRQERDRILDE